MFTSTMPQAITSGTDRAVALCRDLIGLAGHDRGWPTRQFPAEGTARHVELDARNAGLGSSRAVTRLPGDGVLPPEFPG